MSPGRKETFANLANPQASGCRCPLLFGGDRDAGQRAVPPGQPHSRTARRRRALAITETELRLMAAAAMIGLKRMPKAG